MFLVYRLEGTYSRIFDAQFLTQSFKELHLLEVSVAVMEFNVAFVKVLGKHGLIV